MLLNILIIFILIANMLIIVFVKNYKDFVVKNWPRLFFDISILIITFAFGYMIYSLETNRNKMEEKELFTRNYEIIEGEVLKNQLEISNFKERINHNEMLPLCRPELLYETSKNVMSNPLIFKYSSISLIAQFNIYVIAIDCLRKDFDLWYIKDNSKKLNKAEIRAIIKKIDEYQKQILLFEYLNHILVVAYRANIWGPTWLDDPKILKWISIPSESQIPPEDTLENWIKKIDEYDPKEINAMQERIDRFFKKNCHSIKIMK